MNANKELLAACRDALNYYGMACNCGEKCDGSCTYATLTTAIENAEKEKLYARVLVPDYVKQYEWAYRGSVDYSPWVIAHANPCQLENKKLDELYAAFVADIKDDDCCDFSEFIEHIEKEHGYIVLNVDAPGVWSPS